MAKILVTETMDKAGIEALRAAGYQVVETNRDMDVIRREITDADGVIVRIVELDRSLLETASRLKIVSKHGVGVDNIDLDFCRSRGVMVTTTPNGNSVSVAEHAFAMMMALSKHLIPVSAAYRERGFAAKNYAPGVELTGKTLGVIGAGRIGKRMIHLCQGLDMQVMAYDPYVSDLPQGVEHVSQLEPLLRHADVLTLHCSLTHETRRMMDRESIGKMKPTALLINCARGPIVDQEALTEALQAGRLAGAGLDVTDPEPLPPDSPLFQMPNVIVTPHYAPTTLEAAVRVSQMAAKNIQLCLEGHTPMGRIV